MFSIFPGQVQEGDFVDLVAEAVEGGDKIKVKRVRVVKVSSTKTTKDKSTVFLRCWKANTIIDNYDKNTDKWK